jgi:DNA-binding MarR family transcriptional regulator
MGVRAACEQPSGPMCHSLAGEHATSAYPQAEEVGVMAEDDDVEAVLAATRVLVGVSAQSVARLEGEVSLPQLRVLVMVASRHGMNLSAVAAGLGVHPSNATRAVDRLVVGGLLSRHDDPTDRRNLQLDLTDAGREVVERVTEDRRVAIREILERMPASRRRALVPVLRSFAEAAGETPEPAVWSLGWPTTR